MAFAMPSRISLAISAEFPVEEAEGPQQGQGGDQIPQCLSHASPSPAGASGMRMAAMT